MYILTGHNRYIMLFQTRSKREITIFNWTFFSTFTESPFFDLTPKSFIKVMLQQGRQNKLFPDDTTTTSSTLWSRERMTTKQSCQSVNCYRRSSFIVKSYEELNVYIDFLNRVIHKLRIIEGKNTCILYTKDLTKLFLLIVLL